MSDMPSMLNSLESTNTSLPRGTYIQPNLEHGLRVWWAFYWPTTLISTVLSVLLGKILRQIYENSLISAKLLLYAAQTGGFVLNYAVAIFIMHYILKKNFRHFRIGLVSTTNGYPSEPVPRSYSRTLQVWWIYVWRTLVYYAVAFAIVIYPAGIFVGLFRPSPVLGTLIFALLGFVVGAALELFVIYSNILDEDIGDFHVSLLPLQGVVADGVLLAEDSAEQKGS
jgi:hypothetical protein